MLEEWGYTKSDVEKVAGRAVIEEGSNIVTAYYKTTISQLKA